MELSGGVGTGVAAAAETICSWLCYSSCVECKSFNSGPLAKNCSVACTSIQLADEPRAGSRQCKEKDSENCWISFYMAQDDGEEMYTVTVDPRKGTRLV